MRGWIEGFSSDVRIAARSLRRTPLFTLVAVITLALGLGSGAAIYTLLERVVLDPLPYPGSDRLVELRNRVPGIGDDASWAMSQAQYVHFSDDASSFDGISLYRAFGTNVQTPDGPRRALGWSVTAEALPLLGARVIAGRLFGPADDRPDAPLTVVVSEGFWRRELGADAAMVGRTLTAGGVTAEIVGIMARGVDMPGAERGVSADIWMPMRVDRGGSFGNNHVFPMFARLAEGVSVEAAEAELERLTARLPERFPTAYNAEFFERYGFRTQVVPLKQALVGGVSRTLWILFAAVGLVLVIAGINVMNLFLVRMEGRRQELAVRSALGAGRGELARYILAESCLLALAGGVVALLVGLWAVPLLVSLAPDVVPRLDEVGIGGGTVVFTAIASLIVGLGVAAFPLLRSRRPLAHGLTGARGASAGRDRQRLRAGLVVLQVAFALTLVAAAGLLVESMRRMRAIDPGLDPEGVLAVGLFLGPDRYEDDAAIWRAYRDILERIRALPGVSGAGMTTELPVVGGFGCSVQGFEDPRVHERIGEAGLTTCAGQEPTTPGYFEAAGIPVLRGRGFTDSDNDAPSAAAVVVSEAFADRFWPGEDPIGKGVAPNGRTIGPFYHVVGVVGDVPASGLDGDPALAIYYPIVKDPATPGTWGWWFPSEMEVVVKTVGEDPLSLVPAIRAAVSEVDPTAPLAEARSMERILADSTARLSYTSMLLGFAAVAALLLAAVGLYGVISYVVSRRTREIGIRIAIGAPPSEVRGAVIRQSVTLVAVGLGAGLVLALATTRTLEGLLYGVTPTHPLVFGAAAALLGLVSVVASWVPARRAARIDPVEALRIE